MGGIGGLGGNGGLGGILNPELSVQLDSAAVWLRPESLSALNDGDKVATWPNEGTLADATQTGDPRPDYKTAIQNGLAVVRFDGTEYMTCGDIEVHSNTNGMTAYIARQHTASDDKYLLSKFSGGDRVFLIRSQSASFQEAFNANNVNEIASITDSSTWEIVTVSWTPGGAVKTYIQDDPTDYSYIPIEADYRFKAGLRFKNLELGFICF